MWLEGVRPGPPVASGPKIEADNYLGENGRGFATKGETLNCG
jgi:hypothetical protein